MITALVATAMGVVSGWALFAMSADRWLNSGAGVRRVLVGLTVTALVSGAFVRGFAMLIGGDRQTRAAWVLEPLAFWGALMAVMIAVLFGSPDGPGSIFPIVIAFGGAMTAASVAAGWLAGAGAVVVVGRLAKLSRAG